ncbi:hypothetical protein [Roseibium aggregatum]|uniref:hypothetical protein n=1 Tax=Roseibium aggregatum TaxID=187304 RepID=UPI001E297E24|nr:hypothetical protein [Roseibium aggregatum]UES46823.1 hypothetical protein GFK90_25300 [Roseibium aggregatum]
MATPTWVFFVASMSGAFIGAVGASVGVWLRYRADAKNSAIKELIKEIREISFISSEYWMVDCSTQSTQQQQNKHKSFLLECKILGAVENLENTDDLTRPFFNKIDALGFHIPWANFFEDVTGGDFSVADRPMDPERAKSVQVTASKLVRDINAAHLRMRFFSSK